MHDRYLYRIYVSFIFATSIKLFLYNEVLFMIQIITTSHLYHDLGTYHNYLNITLDNRKGSAVLVTVRHPAHKCLLLFSFFL